MEITEFDKSKHSNQELANMINDMAFGRKKRPKKKKKTEIIDLTNRDMPTWEGIQFFNKEEAKDFIRSQKLKKRATVEKDVKPRWYPSEKWKQTYTIRRIKEKLRGY